MKIKLSAKVFFTLIFLTSILVVAFTRGTFAQTILDSDVDGLSDSSEIELYKTNPKMFDTDVDSFSDGQEVLFNSDPNNSKSKPIMQEKESNALATFGKSLTVPWIIARASGIGAFVILSIGMCFGIGISSRSAYRFLRPPTALEVHRFIQLTSIALLGLHVGSLFFDEYIKLKPLEALIPFILADRGVKTAAGFDLNIAVAFGIIALYLIIMLIITSELRSKISLKLWRALHYFSFVAYIAFLGHGYIAGSDSKEGWMIFIYQASVLSVLTMLIFRFRSVFQMIELKRKAQLAKMQKDANTPELPKETQVV